MSLIMDLLDDLVLGPFNLIDRAEGLIRSIGYRDSGHRMSFPRVDKGGKHSLAEVRDLLSRYGMVCYGVTHDAKSIHVTVKKRQARWAEYVLLHAGVELTSSVFDKRNPEYAADHEAGWMPTPWSERVRHE